MTQSDADAEPTPAPKRRVWNLSWMDTPTERGLRPTIGPDGLTLGAINLGSYGEVPDVWPHSDDQPRGSVSIVAATLSVPTFINQKADVWAEGAADLYEQAIRERWSTATDLPWAALAPLPEVEERAICQICTELSEYGLLMQQVLGRWLERISYGFHEVKMCLATQVFDAGRQAEAFRKRALANGGGLGIESPGIYNRGINDALAFTELTIYLHLLRAATTLGLLEGLAVSARTAVDAELYRCVARDLGRQVAFGADHISYRLRQRPEARPQIHLFLDRAEGLFLVDAQRDGPFAAAITVLARAEDGGLAALRARQVARYRDALLAAGLPERAERSPSPLSDLLEVAPVG